jgi:hypothetical protein
MNLNTRELALLIWLAIALLSMAFATSTRTALLNVLGALFQRKIVDIVGLTALYTAACGWVLWKIGLWGWPNLKTIVLWFFTTAFVAIANTKALETGPAMFRSFIRKALAITAIVVFISGINTLPLWAELLMLPFLMLVAAMVAVAEHRPEHKIVLGPLNAVLTISGLCFLGGRVYRILTDWQ